MQLCKSKNGNEQMVYLPSNSMDTILCFAREIDEIQQISTLDFHNPESQIKVSFLLNLKDIEQLKLLMRGRQVFLDTINYIVLGKLASGIQLVQTQNRISVEKKATLNGRFRFQQSIGTIKIGSKDVTTVKRLPSKKYNFIGRNHN